jgi:peptidoglycan/LPS O-acetylase OafA/YrhL
MLDSSNDHSIASVPQGEKAGRIEFIDGLRGLAIISVALFHSFTRWPDLVPYGAKYSEFPFFQLGWLGVDLFFMISGYVILMTLERCRSSREFIAKRVVRLFPAMLFCSVLIYFTANIFYERPLGIPHTIFSLLPGLTFLDPKYWSILLGVPEANLELEGSFWSLYVEFKFYFIAAIIYYWKGRDALVKMLFILFGICSLTEALNSQFSNIIIDYAHRGFSRLGFSYYGWFSAGTALYCFVSTGEKKWFYYGCAISLASSLLVTSIFSPAMSTVLGALAISIVFCGSFLSRRMQSVLSNKYLVFMGFISYPLYLLHENMLISLIVKADRLFGGTTHFLLPLLSFSLIILIAWIIAVYIEPAIGKFMKRYLYPLMGIARRSPAGDVNQLEPSPGVAGRSGGPAGLIPVKGEAIELK